VVASDRKSEVIVAAKASGASDARGTLLGQVKLDAAVE